jgi:hypothetical protein
MHSCTACATTSAAVPMYAVPSSSPCEAQSAYNTRSCTGHDSYSGSFSAWMAASGIVNIDNNDVAHSSGLCSAAWRPIASDPAVCATAASAPAACVPAAPASIIASGHLQCTRHTS